MRVQQGLGNKHPRPPTPHRRTLHPRYHLRICHTIFSKASKDAEWYCPAFLMYCILIGWKVSCARYEDANATGGGAELVEGTVKSTPTCMNRGDKNIVPGSWRVCVSRDLLISRILPAFFGARWASRYLHRTARPYKTESLG